MARFHGTLLTTLGIAVAFTSKDNAIEVVDYLIFDPGPSWDTITSQIKLEKATQDLLASAEDRRCTADLTVVSADELTKVKHILAKTP
jgi:hypothetical protein